MSNMATSDRDWRAEYAALPTEVHRAIYENALTASPEDGLRGVPQSWAVIAYEAAQSGSTAQTEEQP